MKRAATILVLTGGALLTAGAGAIYLPAGMLVAGGLLLAAGIDLGNERGAA